MKILVTGGAGYIGSHTAVELLKAGYDVVIADNFSNSSPVATERIEKITGKKVKLYKIDICRKEELNRLFESENIDGVIHFAAYKAVGESVEQPLKYYKNNLGGLLAVLDTMEKHNVKKFVFSSSATVYGDPEHVPCDENCPVSTATNPYGATKIMSEEIVKDICAADKTMNAAILRYFNPIGAHPSALIGEDPNGIPNNLIPYVAQTAIGRFDFVRVFGDDYPTRDGTGVRDYIHVCDLAKGHVAAIKKLEENCGPVIYNLGTGKGYSVLEVIKAFEKACGKKIPIKVFPRRRGDIAENYADVSKAQRELNWKAQYNLDDMCRDSWNWQRKNPNGYRK
jgi:UDP-glucose 4-epimerase